MPRATVYTPAHNTEFLPRAWRSLQSQTMADFEWIIVANGDFGHLPPEILNDQRVRVLRAQQLTGKIGALKGYACGHAKSDLFVEFDHDDELYPQALAEVLAVTDTSRPQFIYSDFAVVKDDPTPYTPHLYGADWGWESYPVYYEGHQLLAMRAFEPHPVCMSYICWAPNHIRCFTRAGYDAAGGYNRDLPLADDYEIMIKAYLSGVEFVHVPQCLYLYHMHGANTSTDERVHLIQAKAQEISNATNDALVDEWCRRHGYPVMTCDLQQPKEQPVLDCIEKFLQTMREAPENSLGQLQLWNVLPFLNMTQVREFFSNAYIALAPHGWLRIKYPSTDGRAAWLNPLYQSWWNPVTFWCVTRKEQAAMASMNGARFYPARSWQYYPTPGDEQEKLLWGQIDLVPLKGQKQPGFVQI